MSEFFKCGCTARSDAIGYNERIALSEVSILRSMVCAIEEKGF